MFSRVAQCSRRVSKKVLIGTFTFGTLCYINHELRNPFNPPFFRCLQNESTRTSYHVSDDTNMLYYTMLNNLGSSYVKFDADKISEIPTDHMPDVVTYATERNELVYLNRIAWRRYNPTELKKLLQVIPKHMLTEDVMCNFIDHSARRCSDPNDRRNVIKNILNSVPKESITRKVHDKCFGVEFTGKEYNDFFGHLPMYRIINHQNNHNGFEYVPGLNIDTNQFVPDYTCGYGLYFSSSKTYWRGDYGCDRYGCFLSELEPFPDDARVVIESEYKCKADKFVLGPFSRIEPRT